MNLCNNGHSSILRSTTELNAKEVAEDSGNCLPIWKQADRPYSTRYRWMLLGYYFFVIFIRASHAQSSSTTEPTEPGHEEKHEGVHLFKFDWENVETLFTVAIWVFSAGVAKIVFHMIPKLGHVVPESCLLILIGIIFGSILYATVDDWGKQTLPTNTFFFFMLPPIILDAGYFMPNRLFFNNLGTILLFAVVGTVWNTFAIGITLWAFQQIDLFNVDLNSVQIFLFSSLLSAVDPVAVLAIFEEVHVNDILYIIVFGESILNDAVSIVLYRTFVQFTKLGPDHITSSEIVKGVASFPIVALGGTIIGVIWGFLIGFATRFTNKALIIEPIFIFIMSYMAFLMAEMFHFSGVLALIFCGITMKNYVHSNISPTSNTTVKYTLKMLSSSSETVIFIFLGLSTVNSDNVWNWWFVTVAIASCTVYRFVGVFFFTAIINRFRMEKLDFVDQIVSGYGGLRGAVSFALVLLIDEETIKDKKIRNMFITTTIAVVYFTVFIQGCTIKPLVQLLKVKRAQPHEISVSERIHERLMEHIVTTMEAIFGIPTFHNQIREKFRAVDSAYIRPLLVRDYKNIQTLKLIQTYENHLVNEAMNEFRQSRHGPGGKMSLIPEEPEDLPTPVEPPAPIPTLSEPLIIDDSMFRSPRGRKISYNRHALDYDDLEDDAKSIGPTSPVAFIGGRSTRKMGVANSGSYRPARVSQEEIAQRLSSINAPNLNELIQQYYQNQQQAQPQRLYTANSNRRRRNPSSGRQTPTSGRHSVVSTSIPEDEEQGANQDDNNSASTTADMPDISNSPMYDEVFEK